MFLLCCALASVHNLLLLPLEMLRSSTLLVEHLDFASTTRNFLMSAIFLVLLFYEEVGGVWGKRPTEYFALLIGHLKPTTLWLICRHHRMF